MSEESLPATPENIHKAIQLIERQKGGGGTELLPALERALRLGKPEGYSRTFIIATDGYVRVEEEVFDLIRKNLGQANMFAFGIGTAVNRHIIEGMARVGMGEPFIISKLEEATKKAERFRKLIQSPVLTRVGVKFQGFDTYDVEPLSIPDVLAERPVIVFGKWRGQPRGKITLSGLSGNGPYRQVIDVGSAKPMDRNLALRYLWARHRITLLSDYNKLRPNDARIKEVTDLGLSYNLLTAYTSFVAVDSQVRNQDGQPATVRQPLPLPQGVSDYAVGGMKMSRALASPMVSNQVPAEGLDKSMREQRKGKDENQRKVALAEITVSGGLSKESVRSFIEKKIVELERSWQGGEPGGKIVLRLTLNPEGKVKNVEVVSSSLKGSRLQQEIVEQMKKWRCPAPQGNREAKVTIALVLGEQISFHRAVITG
jgi:Ca-activated chloride channel family protein